MKKEVPPAAVAVLVDQEQVEASRIQPLTKRATSQEQPPTPTPAFTRLTMSKLEASFCLQPSTSRKPLMQQKHSPDLQVNCFHS